MEVYGTQVLARPFRQCVLVGDIYCFQSVHGSCYQLKYRLALVFSFIAKYM